MQVEISITLRDLAEAIRDLYKKRGGSIPDSLSSDSVQSANANKFRICVHQGDDRWAPSWPEWDDAFLEVICKEPKVKK